MWLVIQRGSYLAAVVIICSYVITSQALAEQVGTISYQATGAVEKPGIRAERGKQNLQKLRDNIRQYTRTSLTHDTDLMFDHNSIRVQSRFRTTDITTEFRADKDGEVNLRIKIPF